ncbi:MAG: Trehalose synthase [Candidatus Syntrophoarchaeum sp. GoM_oil]|nr:MAG: Trehalose synthase [Candidatus Syntrophoarchaeum sp. GoM_oil]
MKICYISTKSIHTRRWVEYFAERGHEVHLITPDYDNIEGVKVHEVNPKASKFSPFFKAIMIRNLVKKIKPDILHAHQVVPFGLYGALSAFHPFVVSPWGSDVLIFPKSSIISKWLVRFVLNKADLITCDTDHIKEPLIELGAEPQKINLIYFGTDTQKFKPLGKDKKIIEEIGVFGYPMVISLRTLEPLYNVESLIASASLVLKEIPEVKFVIAGKGSEEVRLKDLAKSLGILDSVKFVGLIPNNELPQYLSSMDIYVSTSLSDAGLAASTAEAMACGLPVVITDFGDNRKWVEDGVNGFTVPLKDPKSLAEKIIYLLKNPALRSEFGKRNRRIIEERNNYYKEMEKMERIYTELVERYKR